MFRLEAMRAKHGDCLLLHWGTSEDPANRKIALIDGGPDPTYETWLRPRLAALAKAAGKKQLTLDLTMVSHIDDDHINGILDLAEEIENEKAPADIGILWHNSLEGLLDEKIDEQAADKVTASLGQMPGSDDSWYAKVLSSVPQGQELAAFTKRHGIDHLRNFPYQPLVVLKDKIKDADFSGLKLQVLGPSADELEVLRSVWKEKRKDSITAAYSDKSPYNLSSIIVMACYDGKRALLTGDARGDRIIEGARRRGMLDANGKLHVELLKIMHHGSKNNATKEFYETVTADAYVVSGDDVKFKNPHEIAMGWLAKAREGSNYKVYCTYDLDYMREIFGDKFIGPASNDQTSVAIDI